LGKGEKLNKGEFNLKRIKKTKETMERTDKRSGSFNLGDTAIV